VHDGATDCNQKRLVIAKKRLGDANVLVRKFVRFDGDRPLVLASQAKVLAIERTIQSHFALLTTAQRAYLAVNSGARPLRSPDSTNLTSQFSSIRIIGYMVRTHLFFKVEVEHDEEESPDKIAEAIGRQLRKIYAVREVELSSVVAAPE